MWHLDGTRATLRCESLIAELDLQQPSAGVRIRFVADGDRAERAAPLGKLWQLTLPWPNLPLAVTDAWVRGQDLVAVYGPNQSRVSRAEIYWRVIHGPPPAIGLELLVSIQTELLDDDPATSVHTCFETAEAWWLGQSEPAERAAAMVPGSEPARLGEGGPGSCILRLPKQVSYVEMVHPSDFFIVDIARSGQGVTLQTRLFENRLEKGVIRRGRIRGWFVPTNGDLVSACQLHAAFARSEPPLTV